MTWGRRARYCDGIVTDTEVDKALSSPLESTDVTA
jgi:hypothetical protein